MTRLNVSFMFQNFSNRALREKHFRFPPKQKENDRIESKTNKTQFVVHNLKETCH